MRLIVVTAKYDDDANVWYVEESNVPGLRTEARPSRPCAPSSRD